MSERSQGGFATGFFIGAMLGASVAMLIAPEGGEERRERLRLVYARGKELIDSARGDLDAAVDEGKSAAGEQRQRLEQLQK
jgi:gas vesicle protein